MYEMYLMLYKKIVEHFLWLEKTSFGKIYNNTKTTAQYYLIIPENQKISNPQVNLKFKALPLN